MYFHDSWRVFKYSVNKIEYSGQKIRILTQN